MAARARTMRGMANILLVEDERALNDLLAENLRAHGYEVEQAFGGAAALEMARDGSFDVVVLDWMLPGMDGITVLRKLREVSLVPVLMLTARGQASDIVDGLEAGADDYLPKPTHMRVLRARIAALLRRASLAAGPFELRTDDAVARCGELAVDRSNRTVTFRGVALEATPTEFGLLDLFCSNPGRAFSRDFLLERVWKDEPDVGHRTVDTHIQRLRKKLGDGDATIQTVWGLGYRVKTP